ncbi:LysR family transcriptional regulator [Falsirhodobacter sp. 20TX0035]|uniref:LysR family transcriptional regulator n=1 Tax=Falsirhodobacter sp. 20TX0035 TaxID=3022019 RepID=UPI00232B1310|nr:LysR family transcriptional regulator [Falsirhodobacter sp. 20TX0035]MDB6453078.1 LysR family transcriptional regulator [Falsirhodobacter sp. 20TX0035]
MNYVPQSYLSPRSEGQDAEGPGVEIRLAGVDLNLLIALEALLLHQNVTLAARKIGQTQPAMSRALARLRDLLDDDLLVRGSAGLQLTTRGAFLARRLPAAMAQVREACHLRQAESRVALSISECFSPLLMSGLMHERPQGNTPLRVGTHGLPQDALDQLEARAAEFILGPALPDRDGVASRLVFREAFVTLVAPGTDPAALPPHALIEGGPFPQVSAALQDTAAPVVDVPDMMAASLLAAQGRVALTVPHSIGTWLRRTVDLRALPPPVALPDHEVRITWIERDLPLSHLSLLDRLGAFAHGTLTAAGRDAAPHG